MSVHALASMFRVLSTRHPTNLNLILIIFIIFRSSFPSTRCILNNPQLGLIFDIFFFRPLVWVILYFIEFLCYHLLISPVLISCSFIPEYLHHTLISVLPPSSFPSLHTISQVPVSSIRFPNPAQSASCVLTCLSIKSTPTSYQHPPQCPAFNFYSEYLVFFLKFYLSSIQVFYYNAIFSPMFCLSQLRPDLNFLSLRQGSLLPSSHLGFFLDNIFGSYSLDPRYLYSSQDVENHDIRHFFFANGVSN